MPGCPCSLPGAGVSPEDKKGYDGPPESRKCTDVLCLILFLLFCGVGAGIGVFAIQNGNPSSLVYGKDEFGNVCGSANSARTATCAADGCMWADGKKKTDERWAHSLKADDKQVLKIDNSNAKFTAYPRIQDDLLEGKSVNQFFGVCLNECPTKSAWICSMYGKAVLADSLKLEKFPDDVNDVEKCPGCVEKLTACQESENLITPLSLHIWKSSECRNMLQSCFFSPMPTVSTMYRCFPKYNKTVEYGCDDDNDGKPDAGWHNKKSDVTKGNKCGTLLEASTTQQSASGNEIFEQLNKAMARLGRMVNDLQAGMAPILVCGIGVSMVFGFLWLGLLRYCAKVFVWLTIVLIVVLQTTLTIFFYHKAGMVTMEAPTTADDAQSEAIMPPEIENAQGDSDFFRWCGIGMTALLIVSLVTIATAVKKINVASQIIAEASSAVGQMKAMMLYPMLPVTLISIVFVWFLYVAACLYSIESISSEDVKAAVGEVSAAIKTSAPSPSSWNMTNATNSSSVNGTASLIPSDNEPEEWGRYVLLLHLFIVLWGNAFIQGTTIMSIAGAVSFWYFTKPDSDDEKKMDEKVPILSALGRTIRYHLGSVAFGSCIIALVQLARAIMFYIDQQTKGLQGKSCILRILMKIVHCILWCFEKCVKYLAKNAYIFVALKGSSFCFAAFDTFNCIKANLGQMAIVAGVSGYLMLIGKLVIVALSTAVAYMWVVFSGDLQNYPEPGDNPGGTISSPFMPVIATAILSFFVAAVFMDVYAISIDTILVCFCVDKSANEGKKYYMSNSLRKQAGLEGECWSKDDGKEVEMVDDAKASSDDDGDAPAPGHFNSADLI